MPLDEAESILADIIRRFQAEREDDKKRLQQLYEDTVKVVADMRTDVTETMAVIQLDHIDHEKRHDLDDQERIRQQQANAQRFSDLHQAVRDVRLYVVAGVLSIIVVIAVGLIVLVGAR